MGDATDRDGCAFAIATIFGVLAAGARASIANSCPRQSRRQCDTRPATPLGWYAIGSIGCAAVSPMIGTVMLGREMTISEVDRTTLSCFLGPVGWVLGPVLFPDAVVVTTTPPRAQSAAAASAPGARPPHQHSAARRDRFVRNEVLLEVEPGTPAQYLNVIARRLQLTLLETQSFALTGRSLQRWRIDGGNSVRTTLPGSRRFSRIAAAQANFLYRFGRRSRRRRPTAAAQYVVPKLHLMEAHHITNGDDVLVAVIDSKIDASHPDLAGVIAEQYDALGGTAPAHTHGTGMAGAIAAHAQTRRRRAEGEAARGARFFRRRARARKAPPSTFSRASIGPRARTRASSI